MIEALVTACETDMPPTSGVSYSSFTAAAPFNHALPFLELQPNLASDASVALEPTNFALPAVKAEEPWPPAEANMVHPVYIHALNQLRVMDDAQREQRSRSRAARPELPELPIALNASPCVSMMLHPGRLVTTSEEPMIRIAIVSMLVREALPAEISFSVRAGPWGGESAAPDGQSGGASGVDPLLTFSVFRDEFTQEGPSGPIEAKRILLLRALPLTRTRVSFEVAPDVMQNLGFCATPPLIIDHRPAPPTSATAHETRAPAPPPPSAPPPSSLPSAPMPIF